MREQEIKEAWQKGKINVLKCIKEKKIISYQDDFNCIYVDLIKEEKKYSVKLLLIKSAFKYGYHYPGLGYIFFKKHRSDISKLFF